MTCERTALIHRKTRETQIRLFAELGWPGEIQDSNNHPVSSITCSKRSPKHGHFDMVIKAHGDTHIDDHHLTEDLGIALGEAIAQALGDKKGIVRYGNFICPWMRASAMSLSTSATVLTLYGR